eukprot:gnl/MRDRNA2_/MRDRNA2_179551_c0_seq1.p1 gnl/MRDRNA2_/MRDRNA2_179551_c0~~gnl/MRDRNA2_/MRDRNA2_179551_c0_seq1.p1  ORF type:complete len:570 (+),score=95.93 gnl/MRDRNA2_/MRDRNA2_179551_c0_seq1:91-1710(+)
MDHEVYGFLAAEEFHGLSFPEFVTLAYIKSGVCVFAAQVEGRVLTGPMKQVSVVDAGTVFFAIAVDEEAMESISSSSDQGDWRDVFLKKRFQMFKKQQNSDLHSSEQLAPGASSSDEMISAQKPKFKKMATQHALAAAEKKGELDEWQILDLELRASEIIANARQENFILVLNLTKEWRTMIPFIASSRAAYEPCRMPLVILGSEPPPKALHESLGFDKDAKLGWIRGSPIVTEDLIRAGVQDCSIIACPGPSVDAGGELTAMLDADVVIVNRSLANLGITQSTILEFKRTQNICLLPRPGGVLEPKLADKTNSKPRLPGKANSSHSGLQKSLTTPLLNHHDDHKGAYHDNDSGAFHSTVFHRPRYGDYYGQQPSISRCFKSAFHVFSSVCGSGGEKTAIIKDPPYSHDPRFASGHIFTTRALGSLLARAYYTPGTLEVIQSLVNPDESDEKAVYPWQVYAGDKYVGKDYGDVLCDLVQRVEHPALLIGLFRAAASTPDDLGYVWTNPTYDTVVLDTDLLYALGDRHFGKHCYEQGILR